LLQVKEQVLNISPLLISDLVIWSNSFGFITSSHLDDDGMFRGLMGSRRQNNSTVNNQPTKPENKTEIAQ
jgi:hypothetical protein